MAGGTLLARWRAQVSAAELALALVMTLTILLGLDSTAAVADGCTPNGSINHCYAGISSAPGSLSGDAMALSSNALAVSNPAQCTNQFVDNEMWLVLDSRQPRPDEVEQGQINGAWCNNLNIYHFWADLRPQDNPNNGYNFHMDEQDTLQHVYGNFIWYAGNNTYDLLWYDASSGGQFVYSYSINNTAVPPDLWAQGGTEYGQYPQNGGVYTYNTNLLWLNGSGWQSTWPGAVLLQNMNPAVCIAHDGPSASYLSANSNPNGNPLYAC